MPGSIDTSVALLVDHRSVEDWPRWMVDGSATKVEMDGFGGAGASLGGGGGGGGGAGGVFFLHPAAIRNSENAKTITLIFRLFIVKLPPGIFTQTSK
jgi:hypothetical protein